MQNWIMRASRGMSSRAARTDNTTPDRMNPLVVAIYTAAAAALGNLVVEYMNGRNEMRVETIRADQALVLEAIKTNGDESKAKANLLFLVRAGLLQERAREIELALEKGPAAALPSPYSAAQKDVAPVPGPAPSVSLIPCLKSLNLLRVGSSEMAMDRLFRLRRWQKEQGLPVTGSVDPATEKRLLEVCRQMKG